jgi:hypothetical protein
VEKPTAGLEQSKNLFWGNYSKGKPIDIDPTTSIPSKIIIDQIIPDTQLSPVAISGE